MKIMEFLVGDWMVIFITSQPTFGLRKAVKVQMIRLKPKSANGIYWGEQQIGLLLVVRSMKQLLKRVGDSKFYLVRGLSLVYVIFK